MSRGTKDRAGSRTDEVAAYVATMATELKALVEPHDLHSLAYLLDLVRMEAEEKAGGKPDRLAGTQLGNA